MKRIICLLLSVCMLLCLAACQEKVEHPQGLESTVSTESQESMVSIENKQGEDAYPEMAEVLSQIATMQKNAMLDEFDNLISTVREELASNRDGFETYVSTLDVQVCRADQVVTGLLSDSYSHYGQIENYRALRMEAITTPKAAITCICSARILMRVCDRCI